MCFYLLQRWRVNPKSWSLLPTTFRERNGPRLKAPFPHRYRNGHWIGQERTENKTQLERPLHCTLLQLKAFAPPSPPWRDRGKVTLSAGSIVSRDLPESLSYTLILRPKEQGTTAGRKRLILLEMGTCSHCGPYQHCLHRWTSNKVCWQTNRQKTTNQKHQKLLNRGGAGQEEGHISSTSEFWQLSDLSQALPMQTLITGAQSQLGTHVMPLTGRKPTFLLLAASGHSSLCPSRVGFHLALHQG